MKRYLAEFIGTFALVFCGTGAIIINEQSGVISHAGIAITFGLIVMVMIYAVGNISGAHFNPAVTIAFTAAKKFPLDQLSQYIIAQVGGALLASLIITNIKKKVRIISKTKLCKSVPEGSVVPNKIFSGKRGLRKHFK